VLTPLFRSLGFLAARMTYRLQVFGQENIPASGPAVLVSNHVTYIDALLIQLACRRRIRFLTDAASCNRFPVRGLVPLLGLIPIDPACPEKALAAARAFLARGDVVCFFPEGQVERTGSLLKLAGFYHEVALSVCCPVVPVWLESLWGSIFSFSRQKLFFKWPRQIPYRAQIHFGTPLPAAEADVSAVRKSLYELSGRAFSSKPQFGGNLGAACLRGLKRRHRKTLVVDAYQGGKTLSAGMALAVGIVFSRWIKANIPEKRVGIILPPGIGGTVANLACVLAGKVPVNINFTAGAVSCAASIRKAELKTILTAEAMEKRLPDFPWTENKPDVGVLLKAVPKWKFLFWRVAVVLLPSALLQSVLGISGEGGDEEAGLLFTSGSSGEPKGVVLTHRNILSNVAQIGMILPEQGIESVLGCLPIFHSFGFTATLWWPMISGPRVVTYISPLETNKILETIERHRVALVITTPTFLRAYLRRGKKEQFKHLRMIVTGAEKLPVELGEEFEKKFGIPVCQGYGMTEGSPVIAVNQLDFSTQRKRKSLAPLRRAGSVGRMVPGLEVRVRDAETNAEMPLFEQGMLWFKGANMFPGYLGDPERSAEVLEDGWYKSGDLGRIDEDGFLYIDGRMSRFSKIGGEMVPHGTVEQALIEKFGADCDEMALTVTSVPDAAKGEALVVLSTVELDVAGMREAVLAKGLPNLWVPKEIVRVDKVPVLASGKLDLKACQKLAREKVGG
jgi:acyl-[acyl-carrier-protein]-phospholipid O-acyltransferase/long-chain-fatty-acid--[acyl-carrier-protein] ligase